MVIAVFAMPVCVCVCACTCDVPWRACMHNWRALQSCLCLHHSLLVASQAALCLHSVAANCEPFLAPLQVNGENCGKTCKYFQRGKIYFKLKIPATASRVVKYIFAPAGEQSINVCLCAVGVLTCLYAYSSLCAWCRNLGRCKDKTSFGLVSVP